MKLLLTGATGAVGLQVLRLAIADSAVDEITILSRRPMPSYVPTSPKASVIILGDFLQYPPEILSTLASHDACIWALGGSSKGHTEQSYAVFTVDYVKAAVAALKEGGVAERRNDGNDPFKFVFISGEWADPEETSRFMFARVKGRAEKVLLTLPPESGIKGSTIRPMWFFPPPEDAIHRRTFKERLIYTVMWPIVSRVSPWVCSSIETIAHVAMDLAKGKLDETEVGSARLKELDAKVKHSGKRG